MDSQHTDGFMEKRRNMKTAKIFKVLPIAAAVAATLSLTGCGGSSSSSSSAAAGTATTGAGGAYTTSALNGTVVSGVAVKEPLIGAAVTTEVDANGVITVAVDMTNATMASGAAAPAGVMSSVVTVGSGGAVTMNVNPLTTMIHEMAKASSVGLTEATLGASRQLVQSIAAQLAGSDVGDPTTASGDAALFLAIEALGQAAIAAAGSDGVTAAEGFAGFLKMAAFDWADGNADGTITAGGGTGGLALDAAAITALDTELQSAGLIADGETAAAGLVAHASNDDYTAAMAAAETALDAIVTAASADGGSALLTALGFDDVASLTTAITTAKTAAPDTVDTSGFTEATVAYYTLTGNAITVGGQSLTGSVADGVATFDATSGTETSMSVTLPVATPVAGTHHALIDVTVDDASNSRQIKARAVPVTITTVGSDTTVSVAADATADVSYTTVAGETATATLTNTGTNSWASSTGGITIDVSALIDLLNTQLGSDTFTVSSSDTFNVSMKIAGVPLSVGGVAVNTFSIEGVNGVGETEGDSNNSPVAVADTATTAADTAVEIDVLANDTDADSDTLTVSDAGTASHGTSAITSGGITYTPESAYTGSDSFTYTISDGNGATATTTVSVTVEANNNDGGATSLPQYDVGTSASITALGGSEAVFTLHGADAGSFVEGTGDSVITIFGSTDSLAEGEANIQFNPALKGVTVTVQKNDSGTYTCKVYEVPTSSYVAAAIVVTDSCN